MLGQLSEFDFSLAELLGCTVAEMRDRISHSEYLQWRALGKVRAARKQLDRG